VSAESSSLEAIYFSAPVPRNAHVLTMLGVVFDKVHFPGVYLPRGGYDPTELSQEIERLEGLNDNCSDTRLLIAALNTLQTLPDLETFCQFESESSAAAHPAFAPSGAAVDEIYDVIHGPRPEGWWPTIKGTSYKGIPGGEESVIYPGAYHYLGGAMLKSSATGIPVVNDDHSLAQLGVQTSPKGDATALSTLLALECTRVVLPEVGAMTPGQFVDFREQNKENLRAFRRGMMRLAAKLDNMIEDGDAQHVAERTRFVVDTEIRPALDELRADVQKSNRPWGVRAVDAATVGAAIVAGFLAGGPVAGAIEGLAKIGDVISKEAQAGSDAKERRNKNGLFYLLEVERFVR